MTRMLKDADHTRRQPHFASEQAAMALCDLPRADSSGSGLHVIRESPLAFVQGLRRRFHPFSPCFCEDGHKLVIFEPRASTWQVLGIRQFGTSVWPRSAPKILSGQ